jgi:hypothetical protein
VLDEPLYRAAKHDRAGSIACMDPGTGQFLGHAKEFTPDEVRRALQRCSSALLTAL